jgi:hypothetical protein
VSPYQVDVRNKGKISQNGYNTSTLGARKPLYKAAKLK